MKTKHIPIDAQQVVQSIIASGAYKPRSAQPEEIAEDMAKYAFLVYKAVAKEYQVAEQEFSAAQQLR